MEDFKQGLCLPPAQARFGDLLTWHTGMEAESAGCRTWPLRLRPVLECLPVPRPT